MDIEEIMEKCPHNYEIGVIPNTIEVRIPKKQVSIDFLMLLINNDINFDWIANANSKLDILIILY